MPKNNDLQALRAFAILFVLIQHWLTGVLFWESETKTLALTYFNGSIGVDLFFVVSGYIITHTSLSTLLNCDDRSAQLGLVRNFWLKRIWRLLPAAWFWLFIPALYYIAFAESPKTPPVPHVLENAIAGLLHIANFNLATCFANTSCGPFTHYWSLSLEEQFYIAVPLLILASGRYFKTLILLLFLCTTFIKPLWPPYYFRIDGILLGVLIALMTSQTRQAFDFSFLNNARMRLLFWGLLLAVSPTILASGFKLLPHWTWGYKVIALLSGLMVFAASHNRDYIARSKLMQQLLGFIGDRSYSLYLSHIPAMHVSREFFYRLQGHLDTVPVIAYFGLTVLLILLFAEFSYRCIENPMRAKGYAIIRGLHDKSAHNT